MEEILNDLREVILSLIKPTQYEIETQQSIIEKVTKELIDRANEIEQDYSFIEAQGSTGMKQTQLRNAADIDIFVALRPQSYNEILHQPIKERRKTIDSLFSELVDSWFIEVANRLKCENIQKTYSQHPYLSMNIKNIDVDIVGCFDISDDELRTNGPITAVDRTVHHSRYVSGRIDSKKRDDARILKSFVRACYTYGDMPTIGWMGFPGYSLEIITLQSDDFNEALQILIDLNTKPLDSKRRTQKDLNQTIKFQDNEIFIIDPTDTNRNVASSIDLRAYQWTRHRAQELLQRISNRDLKHAKELILEQPIPKYPLPEALVPYTSSFVFADDGLKHYTILRDKLQSLARKIRYKLEKESTGETRFGRIITEVMLDRDIFTLGFLFEKAEISQYYDQKGPPSNLVDAVESFKQSHDSVFERDGYYWVTRRREWVDPNKMIESILKENPIQGISRIKNDDTSLKILNILTRYILQIETEFRPQEWAQLKESLNDMW